MGAMTGMSINKITKIETKKKRKPIKIVFDLVKLSTLSFLI